MKPAILTALCLLVLPAPLWAADPIGDVTKIERNAFGTPPADDKRELFLGNSVVQDEVVETVIGGGASITFVDGSQFHLGSGSQAALDAFVYQPGSGTGVVELGQGVFRFIGGSNAHHDLEVRTPDAVIGVRGTDFVVVRGANGKTVVGLASGSVSVESRISGDRAVPHPGQIATIGANSEVVVQDAPVKAEDLICWLSRDPYICRSGVASTGAGTSTGQAGGTATDGGGGDVASTGADTAGAPGGNPGGGTSGGNGGSGGTGGAGGTGGGGAAGGSGGTGGTGGAGAGGPGGSGGAGDPGDPGGAGGAGGAGGSGG